MHLLKQKRKLAYLLLSVFSVSLVLSAIAIALHNTATPQANTTSTRTPPTPTISTATVTTTIKDAPHLIQYDQLPGAVKSSIQLKVNGENVFVEKYKDIHYARFAFVGTTLIEVTPPELNTYTISPRSYNIQSIKNGNTIAFSLAEPHKLILQFGDEKLFLLADPPEINVPHLGDKDVINITKYLPNTTGTSVQTANIQHALDTASTSQALVYFPSGKYISGTLSIKSNVSIYLASGALLMGTGNSHDYNGQFLWFNGSQHAKLFGRGVIDLHGKQMRDSSGDSGRVKIIRTLHAQQIELDDVLLRDAGSWTVHLVGSDSVHVTNLKIINDMDNTNGDGIDPDASSHITLDGTFLYTTDDCFAVKASGIFGVHQPTSDILIKNSVCYDKKSALKVGTETKARLSNIRFENNDVVHADRALALYMADGQTMEHISYLNNYSEEVAGNAKQALIYMEISNRNGLGFIKNVVITNYTAYTFSPHSSIIAGKPGHNIDVTFKNLKIAGAQRTNVTEANINVSNASIIFNP